LFIRKEGGPNPLESRKKEILNEPKELRDVREEFRQKPWRGKKRPSKNTDPLHQNAKIRIRDVPVNHAKAIGGTRDHPIVRNDTCELVSSTPYKRLEKFQQGRRVPQPSVITEGKKGGD